MKPTRLRTSPFATPLARALGVASCLPLLAVSSLLSGCANMVATAPSVPIKTQIGGIKGLVHGGRGPVVGANVYLYSPSLTGYGGSGIAASTLNASTPLLDSSVPSTCGAGATATAIVDTNPADPTYQQITGITVITGGAGYTANGNPLVPTVTITDQGGGAGATATAVLGTYNNVVQINVGSGGNGYTAPVVTITPASTSPCQDANGNYYVNSDQNGNFALSGDYTCTAGLPVYAYTLGGDSGSGAGADGGFMAVLGICPASGNFATQLPYVNINELTTVAAAYAVAGFATDPLHIGVLLQTTAPSVSTLASLNALEMTGLTNAFNTAGNIYNVGIQASSSPTTTQTAGSIGTLPYKELNTLADVLANCINSVNIDFACETLLSYTPGMTDTAGAAIYIAQHPASNVANIFAIATANGSPWQPMLTKAPNDWTVTISYTGAGIGAMTYIDEPAAIAADGSGNIWDVYYSTSAATLAKITNLGVPAGPTSTTAYSVGKGAYALAIDINGNAWTTNISANSLSEVTPAGVVSTVSTANLNEPTAIAFEGSGNIIIGNGGNNILVKANSAGTYISKSTTLEGIAFPDQIAIEPGASGNIWVTNQSGKYISYISDNQSTNVFTGISEYNLGSTRDAQSGAAVDANGNLWAGEVNTSANSFLYKVTTANVGTTYKPGINNYYIQDYNGVVMDGGNNVWAADCDTTAIYEVNATSGTTLSGTYGFALPGNTLGNTSTSESASEFPNDIAVDGSGNVWINSDSVATIYELVGAAVPVVTPLAYATANSLLAQRP